MSRPRDIKPASRATLWLVQSLGFRTSVAFDEENKQWIITAKRDSDGTLHVVKGYSERAAIAAIAEVAGVDLMDG